MRIYVTSQSPQCLSEGAKTDLETKLKNSVISSMRNSGRNLKTSGVVSGSGKLSATLTSATHRQKNEGKRLTRLELSGAAVSDQPCELATP